MNAPVRVASCRNATGTVGEPSLEPSMTARLVLRAIGVYQFISGGRLPVCRFAPSCSAYAVEALEIHGARRGAWLALRRLVRCHPWGSAGHDPVPLTGDMIGAQRGGPDA